MADETGHYRARGDFERSGRWSLTRPVSVRSSSVVSRSGADRAAYVVHEGKAERRPRAVERLARA